MFEILIPESAKIAEILLVLLPLFRILLAELGDLRNGLLGIAVEEQVLSWLFGGG